MVAVTDRWVVFVAKLRAWSKILWAVLVAAGGLIVVLLMTRRRTPAGLPATDIIAAEKRERVEAAKAEAAIRIEAAREREGTIKGQLAEVIKDPDGPRRRRNLIELSKLIDKTRRGE